MADTVKIDARGKSLGACCAVLDLADAQPFETPAVATAACAPVALCLLPPSVPSCVRWLLPGLSPDLPPP
eukprot:4678541-Alexandrium_andersonii.AAC.1